VLISEAVQHVHCNMEMSSELRYYTTVTFMRTALIFSAALYAWLLVVSPVHRMQCDTCYDCLQNHANAITFLFTDTWMSASMPVEDTANFQSHMLWILYLLVIWQCSPMMSR